MHPIQESDSYASSSAVFCLLYGAGGDNGGGDGKVVEASTSATNL